MASLNMPPDMQRRPSRLPRPSFQSTTSDGSYASSDHPRDSAHVLQTASEDIAVNPSKPAGVLAFHLKQCRVKKFDLKPLFDSDSVCMYIHIMVEETAKCSSVFEDQTPPTRLFLDDLCHFMVRVNNKRDEHDEVRVQLVAYERPVVHKVVAAKHVHLYDLIGQLYHVETYQLKRHNKILAELDLEICFAYGMMGYGFCSQLENKSKHPGEQIAHSMFFRSEPPPERAWDELSRDVMNSTHVGHPAFINFTTKVDIGKTVNTFGEEISSHNLEIIQEPTLLVAKMRKRLHNMQSEYSRLVLRSDRLGYLKNLIRNTDMVTYDEEFVPPKSLHLKHRTQRAATPPNPWLGSDDSQADLSDALKILQEAPGIIPSRKLQLEGLLLHATKAEGPKRPSTPPHAMSKKRPGTWQRLFSSNKVMDEPTPSTSEETPSEQPADEKSQEQVEEVTVEKQARRRSSVLQGAQAGVEAIGNILAASKRRASLIGQNILGTEEEEHHEPEQVSLVDRLLRKQQQPPKIRKPPKVTVILPTPEASDVEDSEDEGCGGPQHRRVENANKQMG